MPGVRLLVRSTGLPGGGFLRRTRAQSRDRTRSPIPNLEPELESEPEPEVAPEPYPDQQLEQPNPRQQYTAESIEELDARTFVPVARVLEIFQFLFKTVDDALIHQPVLLSRISRAFAEGLASTVG